MSNFELHELLSNYDKKLSERLSINDRVRILRGLEVFFETGVSILEWQKSNKLSLKKMILPIYTYVQIEKYYIRISILDF